MPFQFNIQRFDIYRKVPKDLTQPTRAGAVISIATITFCSFLLLSEFTSYMETEIVSEVYVDDPAKYSEDLSVFLNVSLPHLPCSRVGLDVEDDMGRHEMGLVSNTFKRPLTKKGEGCLLENNFRIAKVSGNFHISTHAADSRLSPEELALQPAINLAHVIHELSFGASHSPSLMQTFHEASSFTPLNDRQVESANGDWHDYFLKIVPSIFDYNNVRSLPYQFTALYKKTPHEKLQLAPIDGRQQAAIAFRYDLAPIVVKYREHEKPFYHFLTQACAIIGGSFTVAGIIDSMIFTASQVFYKAQLGKLP